jgi:hypothetical protein
MVGVFLSSKLGSKNKLMKLSTADLSEWINRREFASAK